MLHYGQNLVGGGNFHVRVKLGAVLGEKLFVKLESLGHFVKTDYRVTAYLFESKRLFCYFFIARTANRNVFYPLYFCAYKRTGFFERIGYKHEIHRLRF